MSVSITWSYTNGGTGITEIVDHGNVSNGSASTIKEIHIRHNGSENITSTKLYLRQYSGTYSGNFTPAADFAEILSWGDASLSNTFGGFMVNFLATTEGLTTYATWPVYNNKSPSGAYVFRTGVGDNEANGITLPTTTGVTTAGEVPTGSTPNVRFGVKCAVPSNESTIGIRQFETVLSYTYTS